jgi:hypothetical protein
MSKTHYFVVMAWENKDGEIVFDQDFETQESRFQDGSTWDSETQDWEKGDDSERDKAYDALVTALNEQGVWDGIV